MRLSYTLSEDAVSIAESIIQPFESCRLESYWDIAGFPTNGWGNLLSRTTKKQVMERFKYSSAEADAWLHRTYPPISQEQADEDYERNLTKAKVSVLRLVKVPLSAGQLGALISFTYNLGAGNLQISTLLRCINRSEFEQASKEFPFWNKAGGIISRGLTRRRLAEQKVFIKGS